MNALYMTSLALARCEIVPWRKVLGTFQEVEEHFGRDLCRAHEKCAAHCEKAAQTADTEDERTFALNLVNRHRRQAARLHRKMVRAEAARAARFTDTDTDNLQHDGDGHAID